MDPLIHANLYLIGSQHFDPTLVSERTGLPMAWGFSLGDVRTKQDGSPGPPAKFSLWCHSSGEFERTFGMQDLLNRFLDELEPVGDELSAIRRELGLSAHITLNIQMDDGVTPDGTLQASTLARLVALDIDLDLDLYTEQ